MALKKFKPAFLPSLALLACVATGMSACKPTREGADPNPPGPAPTESRDVASASQKLSDALSATMKAGTPLTDKAQLANRLHLSVDRVKVFDTGIGEGIGRPTTGTAGMIVCESDIRCTCRGDSECNDMFETVCRDPKTGGKCTTSSSGAVTCECYPAAAN
jgi:hypothetical protein